MAGQKTQAVFLVDTNLSPSANFHWSFRSLCLVCTRILLFLSQFPNKEHLGRVQWNYKFFNSQRHEKSVRTKTAQFYENRSELLQKFFEELQSSLELARNGTSSSSNLPQPPVKLVYSALAAAVQDFTWDAPEIMSPIRRLSPQSKKRVKKGRKSDVKDAHITQNIIFICSTSPQSEEKVHQFLYGSDKESDVSMKMLHSELLPPALLLQLEGKGIAVHWVDMQRSLGQDSRGPFLISSALKAARGTLIPMSTLVSPACNELIQQATNGISHSPPRTEARESECQSKPEDTNSSSERQITRPKSHVPLQVDSGADAQERMDVCPPKVHSEAPTSVQSKLHPLSNSSPTQQNDRGKPVGSLLAGLQSVASESIRKKSKSSLPSHKLLPSLVFPPSTHLREHLQFHTSLTQPESLALQDNLFWLCTVAGKILCILDLSPMHTFCEPQTTTRQKSMSSWSGKTTSVNHSLQTCHTQGKEKQVKMTKAAGRKVKKKLGFSIPESQFSNASEAVSQTVSSCQQPSNQRSPTGELHCSSGVSNKGVAEQILKEEDHTPTVPSMAALGLIDQSDLPLTWLCSATVYSCVGLYVPREFRSRHLDLGSSNLITAAPASEGGSGLESNMGNADPSTRLGKSAQSNESLTECKENVLTDENPRTPTLACTSSSHNPNYSTRLGKSAQSNESLPECKENVLTDENPRTPTLAYTSSILNPGYSTSPSQQVMRVSPQIHLFRFPVTPPSGNTFRKMSEILSLGKSPKVNQGMSSPCYQELRKSPRLGVSKLQGGSQVSLQDQPSGNDQPMEGSSLPRMSELSTTHIQMETLRQHETSAFVSSTSQALNSGDCRQLHQALAGGDSCLVSVPISLINSFKKTSTGEERSSPALSPPACLPDESLSLSGRFHSRWFQHLCLWLARNGLLLLLNLTTRSSPPACSHLAVLQPITSLVATLSLVKPQYHPRLIGKLVSPPPCAHSTAATNTIKEKNRTKHTPVCHNITGIHLAPATTSSYRDTGESQGGTEFPIGNKREREDVSSATAHSDSQSSAARGPDLMPVSITPVATTGDGDPSGNDPANRDREFVACHASNPELYVSLQLLFHHEHASGNNKRATSSLQPALLQSLLETSPFTHLPLLPWFPYLHSCGVSESAIHELQEMRKDSRVDESLSRVQLDLALKALYTSGDVPHSEEGDQEGVGAEVDVMDTVEPSDHAQGRDKQPVGLTAGEHCDAAGKPKTVAELFARFDLAYQEQVGLSSDDDSLQRWAHKTMSALQEDFIPLALSEGKGDTEAIMYSLWEELDAKVLLSSSQLQQKYEILSCEDGGKQRRITEYQLQVFLHFEAMRVCCDVSFDTNAMADKLVLLLRRISLLANPGLMGHCVKEVILPSYIGYCRVVLTEVYEGLMLPLPPGLYCSPGSVPTNPTPGSSDSEETPLRSLQEPLAPRVVTATAKSTGTLRSRQVRRSFTKEMRAMFVIYDPGTILCSFCLEQLFRTENCLVRRTSFQDVQSQRQIAVRKLKKRNKTTKNTKDDATVPRRFSPRLARLTEENTKQSGKGVCRNLFSRSQSFSCEVGNKRKRERDEVSKQGTKRRKALQRHHTHLDVVVKETPIKKQVDNYRRFKLQRLRSKSQMANSPGVMMIEESPRRSFYSAPKADELKPLFKTPPPLRKKYLSPKVILKKEPSPAALHSLLHGEIISPAQAGPSRSDVPFLPENPLTTVGESPDLFQSKETVFAPGLSNSRAARMLTYDTEDPLSVQHKSILKSPLKESELEGPMPSTTENKSVCFLTDLDPRIENESASMMAFALSTPTKEDPIDFHDVFL